MLVPREPLVEYQSQKFHRDFSIFNGLLLTVICSMSLREVRLFENDIPTVFFSVFMVNPHVTTFAVCFNLSA